MESALDNLDANVPRYRRGVSVSSNPDQCDAIGHLFYKRGFAKVVNPAFSRVLDRIWAGSNRRSHLLYLV